MDCQRRYSLLSRLGPGLRTPSGPAVPPDCNSRPDRRLQPTERQNINLYLQRGSHPQRTVPTISSMRQAYRRE